MSDNERVSHQYLRLLNEFAHAILQRSTLDEILWLIADQAIAQLGFEDCVIYLVDRSRNVLVQKAAFGPKSLSDREIKDPIVIPLGQGIVGSVARNQRSERIGDTRQDPRYIVDDEPRLSELAVPIVFEGECLGVIDSEHREANFYTEIHEQVLGTIASMASARISDAMRADDLRRTIGELELTQNTLANQATQLKQARATAEAADHAKSEFLATMSHEIRTPLNAIIAAADLLGDDELNEEQRETLAVLQEASHHLLGLINSILDFSKLEAGQLQLETTACDVRSLIDTVIAVCTSARSHLQVPLKVNISDTVPKRLQLDEIHLRQILVNLVSNALKFTHEGNVQIHASVAARAAGSGLEIRVCDTGIGMSAEELANLFTPFRQADASHARRYGGTGLGLSIAKRLTDLMGGDLAVTSQPGIGTEFRLTLPLPESPALAPSATPRLPTPKTDLKILVVEDNLLNRKVILKMLARGGFQADVAEHGEEGVRAVEHTAYDVVLMDLQMPIMDGFEAIQRIRARHDLKQPTIIVVSGNSQPRDRRRAKEVGADDFIAKPIDHKHLLALLKAVTH